ncbi:THAP domain-containing protein 4-like isoform X2 [Rhopalosiphum maidis]|uniref:THAP domain-containing protein 4-like isoform X2 n=1 Tax=Rhopalosiphum maidis TaxID=43146 RepID=UPI000F0022C6|nr:THAP domain-containing protein 4-like isoform X2 [Rhopalosiphum maidis]
MVCSCSVHLCTNRSNPGSRKHHFFSFSLKNIERTQQWVNAVGRKGLIPTKHSKICKDHFHKNDFKKNIGGSYLLKLNVTAIPSIFPNYSEIIYKAKMQCLEVKSLKVVGCSSDIPHTKNNEPDQS